MPYWLANRYLSINFNEFNQGPNFIEISWTVKKELPIQQIHICYFSGISGE